MEEDPKAEKRMQVILGHLAGQLNATEASQELEISRKTFYDWLERGRSGMFQALRDKPTGRPPDPVDLEKLQLQEKLKTSEKERDALASRLLFKEAILEAFSEIHGNDAGIKKKRDKQPGG